MSLAETRIRDVQSYIQDFLEPLSQGDHWSISNN